MQQTCTQPISTLSQEYERDGYCIVPQVLTAGECEQLKAEAIELLKAKAKERPDGRRPTVFVGVAAANQTYYRLASDPRVAAVLKEIMPEGVMFMSDKFVFKSGTQRFATPWHIDQFYWRGTRPKLSVWIALDDVSAETGALKVVRGSHKKEWRAKETRGEGTNGEFGAVIEQAQWAPSDEVVAEIKKGGMIFFSDRTVHGSCTNTSGLDRYAIISTYHAPAEDEPFDKHFPARHVVAPAPR